MSGLSTFLIGLVVVGAAVAFAIWITLLAEPGSAKRATRGRRRERERPPAAVQRPSGEITRWQRVRSGVLLVTLLTALGVAAALVLLVAGVIIVTGLKTAVQ